MELDGPFEAGGGLEYIGQSGSESPYIFVDRDGEGLVVVIADELSTGRFLRDSVPVP
jgi:hypothetical protein